MITYKRFLVFILFSFYCVFGNAQNRKEILKTIKYAETIEESKPDSSIYYFQKVITSLNKNLKDSFVCISYAALQKIYFDRSEYTKSIEYALQALKSAEIQHNVRIQIICNIGLNTIFFRQNNYEGALKYGRDVISLARSIKDTLHITRGLNNLSDLISSMGKHDSSILYLKEALRLTAATKEKKDYGNLLTNTANAYFNKASNSNNKNEYKIAADYVQQGINWLESIKRTSDENLDLGYAYGLKGAIQLAIGNYSQAEISYEKAISFFSNQKDVFNLLLLYTEVTEVYLKMNNSKKALHSFKMYDSLSKANNKEINDKSITEMQTKYETEKKETENKLLQTENELSGKTIKQQKLISYFIIGGLVLALLFALFIFRGLRVQRKANRIISRQKDEVHHQKEIVEEKQKEILDSIHYAKRIQRAVITSDAYISQHIKNYFIYYQPKDIVSGDFYWAVNTGNKFYLVTADCTGHGVPGAFMSLLNISILNEVIIEKKIKRADLILNEARKDIIKSLNPTGSEESKDGMDCILACFDFENLKLEYAAANNSFYIARNNELIICKADKMPVGKSPRDNEPFTLHTVDLQKGDTVYMLTDGLPDQFGGPKGKKYKYKQLEDLLLSNNAKPLINQQEILSDSLNRWKGNLEQVDDILLIGIKI